MKIEEVRKLIRLVEESNIGELEVWKWWGRIRISRNSHGSTNGSVTLSGAGHQEYRAATPPAGAPAPDDNTEGFTPVKSPMVGTFYRAPAPDADPYVEPGDRIEAGQTLCIIEAMKLMNEIQAEVRGRIVRVLAANGSPVEYGQTLFLVDESS
jgi:acetyl-CoA carboxylase biotin carboxyl carrier protein